MNKNEIRGYIFMGFALLCFCIYSQGDLINADTLLFLAGAFLFVSIICFVNAYRDSNGIQMIAVESAPAFYRIGQNWGEFNLFSIKPSKVNVESSDDAKTLLCDVHLQADNRQSQLQSGGNLLTIRLEAVGDSGKGKIELPITNESAFSVEAGAYAKYVYHLTVPTDCERVFLHFYAVSDSIDEIYEQEYEFYPKHYLK